MENIKITTESLDNIKNLNFENDMEEIKVSCSYELSTNIDTIYANFELEMQDCNI